MQEVAAEVIEPRFQSLREGQIFEKSPGDLVTVADHEAEVIITRRLTEAYPAAVVLGEEAYAADPTLMHRFAAAEHAFTVDPVDGTKNFVHGSPDHAVMLAELHAGVVTRAWVWQPAHEVAWVAERGAGCERNGEVRVTTPPANIDAAQGASSNKRWLGHELGGLPPLRPSWRCCGLDFPGIIDGLVDYLVWRKGTPWDHAPGSLLLTEAGGAIARTDGAPYRPRDGIGGPVVGAASAEVLARVTPHL